MKIKQVALLGVILAALTAGVMIKQFQTAPEIMTQDFRPLEFDFDPAGITSIQIGKGTQPGLVALQHRDGRWHIPALWHAFADEVKIQEFLETLASANGEVRGSDPALYEDFGIDEERAFQVTLKGARGAETLSLLIGVRRAGADGIFVRKPGQANVYLTDSPLLGKAGIFGDPVSEEPRNDFWADLAFVSGFQPEDVTEINVSHGSPAGQIVTANVRNAVQAEDEWQFVESDMSFQIDSGKVIRYIQTLRGLRALKVLDPSGAYGLEKPFWRLALKLREGLEHVLTVSLREETLEEDPEGQPERKFYLRSNASPVVYQIPDYAFGQLDVDNSMFFAVNALGVSQEDVNRFVVRAGRKDYDFPVTEEKTAALETYLPLLETFGVKRLLFQEKEVKRAKSPGHYQLEIHRPEQAVLTVDIEEPFSEELKEYPGRIRGSGTAFAIDETTFQKFFGNLESLTR